MISDDDVKKLKTIFATKDDLKNFVTKSDFNDGLRRLESRIESSNEKFHSKIFDLVDSLAVEIKSGRESRAIFSYRIEDLEKRVKTLEE
ncbi:hypothetical protein KBB48_00210 [Candidatus Shapirobacteria bacterium]|nr:hypothetical protein [Candidatus Shapirobacteria bacterium]